MIAYGSAALILIYMLTTIGTMIVLPIADINPVTGVIGNLGVSGFPGLMEVAAVVLAGHRVRRDDDLSGGLLAPDLRVGPGAPPAANLHPPQPPHPESGDGHPRPRRAVVADPGRAVFAEQHGQRDDIPAGRPECRVADLGILLLHPVGHRQEEVRRSLCQRGLLANSWRHGRGCGRWVAIGVGGRPARASITRLPRRGSPAWRPLDDVGRVRSPSACSSSAASCTSSAAAGRPS